MGHPAKTVVRPWGSYREFARNLACTVWMVEMNPGEIGSLQAHKDFDELWIVLTEGALVQVGEAKWRPKALEEIWIPRGARHRLSNEHGTTPLRMFEVAYGDVRDEDKVRYEDKYGRV
jgi:mannose-1-phosphate guanylyltransferase/mannose-6-phosphate isomerase